MRSLPHNWIDAPPSASRNPAGPSGPVSFLVGFMKLSDVTWPTGRRSRWPSPLPWGSPSISRAPAGVTVTRCVSVSQAAPSRVSSRHTSTRPEARSCRRVYGLPAQAPVFGSASRPGRARISAAGLAAKGDSAAPPSTERPRRRIMIVSKKQNSTSSEPLMNCTQVVDTMPAVTTMVVTTMPTRITPATWGRPSSGVISAPAPTICGIR